VAINLDTTSRAEADALRAMQTSPTPHPAELITYRLTLEAETGRPA
jgi:hypothetical protein